jgi:Family of unknown function (DUF6600)
MFMKTFSIPLIAGLAGILALGALNASADLEVSAGVSIHSTADFKAPLASCGTWIDAGSYGRCWRPVGVSAEWRPYCNGHWEWTDCGWYWVSSEPWAWACYHYGAWAYDPNFGWIWVPGIEWAPAWVYWRIGAEYIGWVPAAPDGAAVASSFYVFVKTRDFTAPIRPATVIVNNPAILKNTTEITGVKHENRLSDGDKIRTVVVNEGPGVDVVEKASGKKIPVVSIQKADRQTAASIPEKFKHPDAQPVPENKPAPRVKPPAVQPDQPAAQPGLVPGKKPEIPSTSPGNAGPDQNRQQNDKDKDRGPDKCDGGGAHGGNPGR